MSRGGGPTGIEMTAARVADGGVPVAAENGLVTRDSGAWVERTTGPEENGSLFHIERSARARVRRPVRYDRLAGGGEDGRGFLRQVLHARLHLGPSRAEAEHADARRGSGRRAVQPVTMTRPRAVDSLACSSRVAAFSSASVAPGQVRWNANSESCGGASITIARQRGDALGGVERQRALLGDRGAERAPRRTASRDSQTRRPGKAARELGAVLARIVELVRVGIAGR